jgi:hypothetical protein
MFLRNVGNDVHENTVSHPATLENLRRKKSLLLLQFPSKLNSVALVRKPTIPTERSPLVEISANFLRIEGVARSAQRISTAVNLGFLDRNSYFSVQVASQLSSRG